VKMGFLFKKINTHHGSDGTVGNKDKGVNISSISLLSWCRERGSRTCRPSVHPPTGTIDKQETETALSSVTSSFQSPTMINTYYLPSFPPYLRPSVLSQTTYLKQASKQISNSNFIPIFGHRFESSHPN